MSEKIKEAENTEAVKAPEADAPEVKGEIIIKLLSNGSLDVSIPEGGKQLEAIEVEMITRQVYEQLRDGRVAQQALELFKNRLG